MSSEFEFAPGEVKSVLTTIRAAAAVDGPCTLTYPQVHTLQKMLIALLPPVAEPVIVGEDAYPDLTDDQWEKLVTLLPQDTQRRIVSRIQFGSTPIAEPPADANARLIQKHTNLSQALYDARLPRKPPADAEVAQAEVMAWRSTEDDPPAVDEEVLLYCPQRAVSNHERVELAVFRTSRGSQHAWSTLWAPVPWPGGRQRSGAAKEQG